jgi:hypothetical protein
MTWLAGAAPTSFHCLGTRCESLTAYVERELSGDAAAMPTAASRPSRVEGEIGQSMVRNVESN